ncbi:MAG: hypothetical protein ACOC0O_06590 [Spirochaetota bacterium]
MDWGALGFTIQTLYGEDLDPRKTSDAQQTLVEFFSEFAELHARFGDQLRSIADAL